MSGPSTVCDQTIVDGPRRNNFPQDRVAGGPTPGPGPARRLRTLRASGWKNGLKAGAGLAGLTAVGALILGYHPYAEDGGIYLAEIQYATDRGLYGFCTEFVVGHLGRFPGFADAVGWLVRATGWRLDWLMPGLQLGCLFGLLTGTWALAGQCYKRTAARWGAVGLVALCAGLPVAGTSLMLVDPYVTARTVAFALTVPGLAGVMGYMQSGKLWKLGLGLGALGLAMLTHPLMGGYGAGAALVLGCLLSRRRWVRTWGFLVALLVAVLAAGVVQAMGALETAEYRRVAATRYYWFLGEWHWYELLGAVAPLGILGWVGWRGRGAIRALAWMGVAVGGIAVGVAGSFAHEGSAVYAVARLQPLRCFQVVYLLMLVVLGGWLGEQVLRESFGRWAVAAVALGGLMGFVQRQTYPYSAHMELPGLQVVNPWEQAFLWVRENTPRDALFALDADYVHRAQEDAQGFRAVAERSALPDYSKDGGQAAIRPELTHAWMVGQMAQTNLTEGTDGERTEKLGSLGVTWLVMGREARTAFVCPYENAVVKVCRFGL